MGIHGQVSTDGLSAVLQTVPVGEVEWLRVLYPVGRPGDGQHRICCQVWETYEAEVLAIGAPGGTSISFTGPLSGRTLACRPRSHSQSP